MSENTNNNHIIKNKEETVLKTLLTFNNTHPKTQPVNNEFNIHYEKSKHYE